MQRAFTWLQGLRSLRKVGRQPADIPHALWRPVLDTYPFLASLRPAEQERLRGLCSIFLAHKEFHGTNGLAVTDAMALAVAAQACLPLLHMGTDERVLGWYGDFVGIVLHPGEVLARRQSVDDAGVVHSWKEALTGEAMQGGPLTLSWQDVAEAGASAESGYNVVIHEFVHVIDMHSNAGGEPDGCPLVSGRQERKHWKAVMTTSYQQFCDTVAAAERFGSMVPAPWLDPYAAGSTVEFFAVTAEAYFVAPAQFARHFPELLPLYDGFFRRV